MTHHRTPEKQMLTHLRNFVASHQEWIKKVGAKHFQNIGVSYKKYVREIFKLEWQFDILTILIFARCFHIHICIIVSQGYWTTQAKNKNVHQCEITLAYSGTGLFSDTEIRQEPVLTLPSPMEPSQSAAINLSGRKRPRPNYNLDQKKKKRKRKSRERSQPSETRSSGTMKKPFKRTSKTSLGAGLFKLEDVLPSKKRRLSKPKDLKEPDPVLDAFKDMDPQEVENMLKDDTEDAKQKDNVGKDLKTEDGTLNIKTVGIRRKKSRKRLHSCARCDEKCRTLEELEKHNETDHSGERFTCTVDEKCQKSFKGYNALHKHEKKIFSSSTSVKNVDGDSSFQVTCLPTEVLMTMP